MTPHERDRTPGARKRLEAADAWFEFLWRRSSTTNRALRDLLWLTLLVSALVVAAGAFVTLAREHGDLYPHRTIGGELLVTAENLSARLSLGLWVCTALAVVHSVLDGALERRRAKWTLVVLSAKLGHTPRDTPTLGDGPPAPRR